MSEAVYAKAWLLFFVLATVGGFVVGAIVGFFAGAILGAAGVDLSAIKMITGALGFIVGLPISYLSFRWSVSRFVIPKVIEAHAQHGAGDAGT